jgi:putative acetyltransferase
VHIRPAQQTDHAMVLAVHREAFRREGEAALVDRLEREGVDRISLVAEVGSRVVGHVLFSEARLALDSQDLVIGALGPVGVLRDHQRHGIAAALIRRGLELSWERGWPAVIVLGDPAYYERFGFRRADAWSIRCELDVPAEAFMIAFAAEPVVGPATARYHAAFASV